MFEMQEAEHAQSVFTDDELRDILAACGPKVKDLLLTLFSVPLVEVQHDTNRDSGLDMVQPRRGYA